MALSNYLILDGSISCPVDTIGEVSNEEAEEKVGLLLIEAKAKMS